MNNFESWDYIEMFTAKEASFLIAGINPNVVDAKKIPFPIQNLEKIEQAYISAEKYYWENASQRAARARKPKVSELLSVELKEIVDNYLENFQENRYFYPLAEMRCRSDIARF